ncbi:S phase cyclin A-associated protein in the endoplasmic reticulum-like [Amphibalanus amphitrite]|uniref:S phase cyclin A-associated protein in the endoplasmic reticulum-like n=1 Tax=Amphibalanus amphitrite TaxID=1232801 RepID=UPI001C922385|nr:S phase cyclin A-associated protein in the endoplasmic reticulum-like [Amphibalanus amphitrite]
MATPPTAPAPSAGLEEKLDGHTNLPVTRTEPSAASDVRVLVQEEGRAARNLLVFNVLVDNKSPGSVLRSARRQPAASPRAGRPGPGTQEERPPTRAAAASAARKRGRARSVSAGRGSAKDLHARYWTFLFENLRRAVDEIYQTCETDDSVLECKETIMILERCTQDFRNLIEWLKIKWEYDHTPKPQRPASVAWEIRKTSPGKQLPMALVERRLVGELSRKQLAFEERHSRPDSVSSGSVRAEPDAAVGRYLEQALRSAMGSPETPADTARPPPPPAPPPAESEAERVEDRPARGSPPPAQSQPPSQPAAGPETTHDGAPKPTRARTAARARGGRAAASVGVSSRTGSGVSPRGGGRGTATRPASAAAGAAGRAEQKAPTRPGPTQPAGRGTAVSSAASATRPERPGLAARRAARGGASRAAGPPPVVR